MFLKTVPPVVAVHTEWRSGKSFSLPLCFNDSASDSDFASTSGTPIPHKVQMIIDSLRSTQSSDMSDNVQASTGTQSALDLARHAGHKVKSRHSEGAARSRRMTADCTKLQPAGLVSSEGSDSDDSVDRGIEEAIQQYLKEKGDPQRKEELEMSPLQTPKLSQKRDPGVPEPPKQLTHSNSNKVLTASNHDQKGTKEVQNLGNLKKKKKKKLSKENPGRKLDASKVLPTKALPSSEVWKASSSCSSGTDRTPSPLHVKHEESQDSSSDDGIEEAIQRFQLEQKERHEMSSHLTEEQDSSSDDGIEEAIRHYQQEKQKQEKHKCLPKQSPLMDTQHNKVPILPTDHPDLQSFKALPKKKSISNKKKSAAAEREGKCASPKPLAVSHTLSVSPVHSLMVRGDTANTTKAEEPVAEQQIHSTLTVNTTAELMCAEAILDISKTVMPTAFEPNLSLTKTSEVEASPCFPSVPPLQTNQKSDESSVDSEDGIEQEIRKFLELKAKLHEQPPAVMAAPVTCLEGLPASKVTQKKKSDDDQSKSLRLSLSRKRKRKEEDHRSGKRQPDNGDFKEEPQPVPVTQSDSFSDMASHVCSPITTKHTTPKQNSSFHGHPEGSVTKDEGFTGEPRISPNAQRFLPDSERNYSSDKSSSLDSDEDLDAAIKDLLKTKTRVKKKVRDLKLKARKRLAQTPDKTHKFVLEQKGILTPKPAKPCILKHSKEQRYEKTVKPKSLKPHQSSKKPKTSTHDTEVDCEKGAADKMSADPHPCVPVYEDSSSVDSDDSIEQEIRRFLAEKAKVSTVPVASVKEEDVGRPVEAGSSISVIRERDIHANELQVEEPVFSGALLEKGEQPKEMPVTPASMLRHPNTTSATDEGLTLRPTICSSFADPRSTDGHLARTSDERRNGSFDTGNDQASFREGTSADPFIMNLPSPRDTQCQVKHQNLFLMKPENCSMTDIREPTSVDFRDKQSCLQNRTRIPLKEVISAVCPSPVVKPHISSPSESPVISRGDRLPLLTPESRTDSFYLHSRTKRPHWDQPPRLSPSVPLPYSFNPNSRHLTSPNLPTNPSHLSCAPLPPALSQPHITASVVRLRRDQAAVIPLSPHMTNHLQLRNRQEERESERMNEGRKEEDEEDEKCIDETDLESGEERRSAEQQRIDKRQQQRSSQ